MNNINVHKLLIIEDDEDLSDLLKKYFKTNGYEVDVKYDALGPLSRLRKKTPENIWDVILTDLKMPGMNGLEFIREVKALNPNLPVILMTAHGGVDTAVEAVREGAYDFVMKPLNFPELSVSIERAIKQRNLEKENLALRECIQETKGSGGIVIKSQGMKQIEDLVKRVAPSTATILIRGESGTGKEVIAKAIHQMSRRNEKPFIAINCAAIPENLLESELFGFAKGSFTGAIDKKVGLFEEAEGGTLFLDEIGDLSGALQAKLLRVLQEKQIKRIGENQPRDIDVRVIAATHRDLEKEVQSGKFREDLFFRLNVIPIQIPPLRERIEDIIPLAEHFLKKYNLSNQKNVTGFSMGVLEILTREPWKGNVRELENAIERAVVLCLGDKITEKDLLLFNGLKVRTPGLEEKENLSNLVLSQKTAMDCLTYDAVKSLLEGISEDKLPTLEEWQLLYIQNVVDLSKGIREKARKILDIDRKTLYKKLDQYSASTSTESAPTSFSN